jgi:hypothetical protein
MQGGIALAFHICIDINTLKVASWTYYTMAWGIIYTHPKETCYKLTYSPSYYAFKHFSHFIKPGYTFVNVPDKLQFNLVVAKSPDSRRTVLVYVNSQYKPVKVKLKITLSGTFKAYLSYMDRNLKNYMFVDTSKEPIPGSMFSFKYASGNLDIVIDPCSMCTILCDSGSPIVMYKPVNKIVNYSLKNSGPVERVITDGYIYNCIDEGNNITEVIYSKEKDPVKAEKGCSNKYCIKCNAVQVHKFN